MNKNKKIIAGIIVGVVVIAGGSFYAGTKFAPSRNGGFEQSAGTTGAMRQGVCLKIVGSWFFSPHAASGIIEIPQGDLKRAFKQPMTEKR